jgi:hypothetical protein
MASDPNFNLRTHERLFTGSKRMDDPNLKAAAWAAVPKCSNCGAAVMFDGGKPKHYDARWDKDLEGMNIADRKDIQLSGPNQDADHPAVAEVPRSGAPEVPRSPVAGPATGSRPDASTASQRAAETRARNRTAFNQHLNERLGRQWNAEDYDENGILKPGTARNWSKD